MAYRESKRYRQTVLDAQLSGSVGQNSLTALAVREFVCMERSRHALRAQAAPAAGNRTFVSSV